jgi:hypothetical protein
LRRKIGKSEEGMEKIEDLSEKLVNKTVKQIKV